MSLLDDVSVVVTPNGYKAGTLHGVIPSDGSADMDVTRATAGTRVDENGLVNYAEVVGSELVTNGDFTTDSDWTKGANTTISGGKLNSNSAGVFITAYQSGILTQNQLCKYSVTYTITSGSVRLGDSIAVWSGSTQSTSGTYTGYITVDSSSDTNLYISSPSSNFVGSIDNISVKEVDLNNVPRIDYSDGGCPHILAEPQRTNLLVKSNDYSSNWVITGTGSSIGGSVTGISQDINGTSLTLASGGLFYSSITPISNGVMSIYMRVPSGTVDLQLGDPVGSPYETKTLTTTWQRFSVVDTGSLGGLAVYNSISGTTITIEVCAAQLEAGSYATSYIPTSGSTVTRNQDQFTRDGIASLINSTEGVLFVEFSATQEGYISLSDGSATNRIFIGFFTNNLYAQVRVSSSVVADMVYGSSFNTTVKAAIKYKENDFALWVDGAERVTDTSGAIFSSNTLNKLGFTDGSGSSNFFFGKVKQLQVYKTALTDAQLTSLTT